MTGQVQTVEIEEPHTPLPEGEFKHALATVAPHLRAFGRALCGSADRADDLAQETMLKAWAARDRYRAGTNFKAWTFTILRNQFYSETRRNRFRGEYDETMAERILYTPGSQEAVLELGDVVRALEAIPSGYREALILVSVEGMSYEEAADVCNIAVGTVKSRVSRARAMLSNIMTSGTLPDFRHNFVLKGESIDAFFAELVRIANHDRLESRAA
ncbi:MAG: sigma-70 family RNA polymerase sigma factor [Novosphingobium sp.]